MARVSIVGKATMYLPMHTVERAIAVVADLADLDHPAAFTEVALTSLARLIGCDILTFTEVDLPSGRIRYSDYPDGTLAVTNYQAFSENLDQHPLLNYYRASGDGRAVRMSDVVGRADWHRLDIYQECYRPRPTEHVLGVHLPSSPTSSRAFAFNREHGDFTESDRDVLDLLRGPLAEALLRARTLHRLEQRLAAPSQERLAPLTGRERQVLELVAAGRTNVAIAHALQVSPRTVAKHLERTYRKLGVGNRAAAVAPIVHAPRSVPLESVTRFGRSVRTAPSELSGPSQAS
jgi:DNA-binding CsgD family transcriptional regulator